MNVGGQWTVRESSTRRAEGSIGGGCVGGFLICVGKGLVRVFAMERRFAMLHLRPLQPLSWMN